jgi:hypothetical protein
VSSFSLTIYNCGGDHLKRHKKDLNIDSFQMFNGETIKIFQYADDTSVIVHSEQALQSLFSLFEKYEQASGAKLNIAKSHGLLFGSWKNRVDLPVQLNWSSDAITVSDCQRRICRLGLPGCKVRATTVTLETASAVF